MFYTALSDFCAILAKVYTHYCFCEALIAFTVIASKRGVSNSMNQLLRNWDKNNG